MKSKVLLIGGNGFIGSHLIDKLLLRNYSVRVLDSSPERFRSPLPDVEYLLGSFADMDLLRRAIDGSEILIHLAHSTVPGSSLEHPEREVLESVESFVGMVNGMGRHSSLKLLFVSTGGAVYGEQQTLPITENSPCDPISPYGVAKLMMEKYLSMFHGLHGLQHLIVRPSNPYGPRQNFRGQQGVIPIFMQKILHNQTVQIWGSGDATKDYLYVGDMVEAIVDLMEAGFDNEIYNIGCGHGRSLNEIVSEIEIATGHRAKIEHLPSRSYDVQRNWLSISKLKARVGWTPKTSIRDGLRATRLWMDEVSNRGNLPTTGKT